MPCQDRFVRAGATSHNAIAAKLNERNVRTARGGVWTHAPMPWPQRGHRWLPRVDQRGPLPSRPSSAPHG